jgi:hypothetical protein
MYKTFTFIRLATLVMTKASSDLRQSIVDLARQLCSGIHKVQDEGVGQEIRGDELH